MIRRIKFIADLFKIHRKSPLDESVHIKTDESPAAMATSVSQAIRVSSNQSRRKPIQNEPLAFCADCHEWMPMRWLPVTERGKTAEQWFQCEYCHGRNLTLRYLSAKEAIQR